LHCALSGVKEEAFTPEVVRPEDVVSLVGDIISAIPITIEELSQASSGSGALEKTFGVYKAFIQEEAIVKCMRQVEDVLTNADELGMKIRIHGDLHLGQFLQVRDKSSHDFVIIDFEGEPLRPVCERLKKSSPLRDVAGMLRSFDYSGYSAAFRMDDFPDQKEHFMELAREWGRRTGEEFLEAYLEAMRGSCAFLLPRDSRNFQLLLLCFKLEKALYEVRYELRNRPRWVSIALRGTLDTINEIRSTFDCGE
jgi:trehalose synthase-fused probable maltokinase